jgi:hypothetical protein
MMILSLFNAVTLVVNGEKVASDNILYEGTTYVPLRVISEQLGKNVNWDSVTKTVYIENQTSSGVQPTKSDSSVKYGNTKGNFARGGGIVEGNRWLYRAAGNESTSGLYKMKPDGSQATKLLKGNPSYLNYDPDESMLYYAYYGIHRIGEDGQNPKKLDDAGNKLLLVDDWIYYSGINTGVFKMRKDGTEKTRLTEFGELEYVESSMLFFKKDGVLWTRNLMNGNVEEKLIFNFGTNFSPMTVHNGSVYFHDFGSLYKINPNDSKLQTIYSGNGSTIFSAYIEDQTILLTEVEGDAITGKKTIVKMNLDGSVVQRINDGATFIEGKAFNNLYLLDLGSDRIYRWYVLDGNSGQKVLMNLP